MKCNYGLLCLWATTIGLSVLTTVACGQQNIETSDFVSKYRNAWDSPIQKNFRGIACTSIATGSEMGRKGRDYHCTEFVDGEYWRSTCTDPSKPDRPESINIRNPTYSFSVERRSNGKFLLDSLEQGVEYARYTSVFSSPYADRWACRTLLDIFSDPKTKFHRIRETYLNEKPVFEVAVECAFKSGGSGNPKVVDIARKMRYFVLRDNFLVVASCDGIEEKPHTFFNHTLISYDNLYGTIDKIVDVSVKNSGISESVKRLTTFEVTSFKKYSINKKEFKLSFYGMPEPLEKASSSRLNFWMWIVFPAFLLVSLYLVVRNRRAAVTLPRIP